MDTSRLAETSISKYHGYITGIDVINQSVKSLFEIAQLLFDIALGLVGLLSLWLGLLRLGERSGIIAAILVFG